MSYQTPPATDEPTPAQNATAAVGATIVFFVCFYFGAVLVKVFLDGVGIKPLGQAALFIIWFGLPLLLAVETWRGRLARCRERNRRAAAQRPGVTEGPET